MKRLVALFAFALLVLPMALFAQSFANGDLNGTVGISTTPTSWSQVPFGDPVSYSTMTLSATSDVTSTTGPLSGNINGNPYAGTTLVSGLHLRNSPDIWHEGIMQTVSGLTIGQAYTIRFYANVIKQSNATDPTGTWTVYKENTLIAISAPITDNSAVGSNAHPWVLRTVTFTATATSHNIKFLPRDDDATIDSPNGVRMGIDSITLRLATVFATPMEFALSMQGDDVVKLNWEDDNAQGLSHYTIEHSPDGLHFEQIGTVEVGQQSGFEFVDDEPFIESYYRIGMVKQDGSSSYTEVKVINTLAAVETRVYGRQLKIHGGYGGVYDVLMRDMQGRTVFAQIGPDQADLSQLGPGIYYLRVISVGRENAMMEKKLVLQ